MRDKFIQCLPKQTFIAISAQAHALDSLYVIIELATSVSAMFCEPEIFDETHQLIIPQASHCFCLTEVIGESN